MENGAAKLAFELPPCGSLLLFLANEPSEPGQVAAAEKATSIAPSGPLQIRRIAPNVLTLDYVDITAGGETRKNVYYYRANQLAWQKNGLPRNPWDSAVQYKDELISKKFPPESGFEVTYRFTIDGAVPKPLCIVIERPDLYSITCNGTPVTAAKDSWWLDKAFGKIDITAAAKPGENAVTLKAQPFTMYHEIAAAFVLGEFSLRPAAGRLRDRAAASAVDIQSAGPAQWIRSPRNSPGRRQWAGRGRRGMEPARDAVLRGRRRIPAVVRDRQARRSLQGVRAALVRQRGEGDRQRQAVRTSRVAAVGGRRDRRGEDAARTSSKSS